MTALARLLFGNATFSETEESAQFRYKFLIVLMVSGAFFTLLFVVGEYSKVNRIQTLHFISMQLFIAITLGLWLALRSRSRWFIPIAWAYEVVCLLEYSSALWLVPGDELRILWFFVNIPGVFIMLGAVAGWGVTAFTIAWLLLSNALMPSAYSSNAMATAALSMIYLGVFFHAYGLRSLSYLARMQAYNENLQQLATHDTLTDALNARAYYTVCDQNIRMAQRSASPYSVLFIDLDHFKRVNDTYGHDAGDAVLRAVSACISNTIRKSDAMGRIGGEEFSVFLPQTDLQGALQIAETVRASVEALQPSIGDRRLLVTASIGVATCTADAQTMEAIQKNADQAMYAAKAQGRNRVSALS